MTTILAEAFGRMSLGQDAAADVLGEDLYSIFLARSQLMGWSTINSSAAPGESSPLWDMNEAELTEEEGGHRIGFAQVGLDVGSRIAVVEPARSATTGGPQERGAAGDPSGLRAAPFPGIPTEPSTDPVLAIPALIQCLDDSLRWFGEVEVTAVQVTAFDIAPRQRSYLHRLVSELNWFNIEAAVEHPQALVTVATEQWNATREARVVAAICQTNTGPFEIGARVRAPAECAAGPQWGGLQWGRTSTGLDISMPVWSAGAVGWVIARLFETALSLDPIPQHLSVRATRTLPE